jgi:hypothetical protein
VFTEQERTKFWRTETEEKIHELILFMGGDRVMSRRLHHDVKVRREDLEHMAEKFWDGAEEDVASVEEHVPEYPQNSIRREQWEHLKGFGNLSNAG